MTGSKPNDFRQNDVLRFIVSYTLMRLAVLLMLVLLSVFVGTILVPALATFLPGGGIKDFLTDKEVGAAFGTVTVCIGLVWVFSDDGRLHAPHDSGFAANAAASVLLVYIFYFIPAVFRDSFTQEGRMELFYKVLYYPTLWAVQRCSTFTAGVLVGILVMITSALGAYVAVYVRYRRRYRYITSRKNDLKKSAEGQY